MKEVSTAHIHEWVDGSGVDEEIAELNIVSVSRREALTLLRWEGKGDALTDGWWCGSLNPVTGEETDFGQYKPDSPYVFGGKGRRAAKYLSPSKMKTEAIYLRMLKPDFWRKVLEDLDLPIVITEGVKKAGALMSLDYAAIALVGVWNGQQAKGRELIDSLKAFAQPGRRFIFAFDADLVTNMQVRAALEQLGHLLTNRGCFVSVAQWRLYKGKGIDDLKVNQGDAAVETAIDSAISFDEWLETETHEMPSPQTITGKVWNYVTTAMADKLEIDEFTLLPRYGGKELIVPQMQAKISEINGTDVSRSYLISAVMHYAKLHPYSDVREYLQNCRVMHPKAQGYIKGLCETMGLLRNVERVLLARWLTAAVARAMKPGCKFDSVLIQKGVEGLGKTKLMSVLAGKDRFYETTADPSNKDFRQITVANWILELGEIENTFRRADIGALKMYITQTEDVFRVPYEQKPDRFPRHFLFCGSTNSDEVITDPDGVRRWWVIEPTKRFDMDWVERYRDNIWAEAVGLFESSYPIYLSPDEAEVFKGAMQEHRTTKGYYQALADIKKELIAQPFKTSDILANKFQKYPGSSGYKTAQMDLAQDLKLLGFVSKKCQINGEQANFWVFGGEGAAGDFPLPDFLS